MSAAPDRKEKVSAVGFEPTRISPPELESGALDRSAKLTAQPCNWQQARRTGAALAEKKPGGTLEGSEVKIPPPGLEPGS